MKYWMSGKEEVLVGCGVTDIKSGIHDKQILSRLRRAATERWIK